MRTSSLISLLAGLLLAGITYAQAPDTLWTRTFGGIYNDVGWSVQQTSDGGFIIGGSTQSFGAGSSDVWLIKTDESGIVEWNYPYGGTGPELGRSVYQTSDHGYVIVGATDSYGAGQRDIWLLKTDVNGNLTWSQTFGSIGFDEGHCVQQTSDGGYIVVGQTNGGTMFNDVYLIKTYTNGSEQWHKTFGGEYDDIGEYVQQTSDGGYIITGRTSLADFQGDLWLIKTNSNGDSVWSRMYGEYNNLDLGRCVEQTSDGGYIVTGCTTFGGGYSNIWLLKTDENGDTLWTKIFGGASDESGLSVQQTDNGGYIIAGETYSFGQGSYDAWVIKTDVNGDSIWSKFLGGTDSDEGLDVWQTADNGFIVTGVTWSYDLGNGDVWLIRLDNEPPPPPPSLTVTLTPLNPPIIIPPAGGYFDYIIELQNNTTSVQTFDIWCTIQVPGSSQFEVLGPFTLSMNPGFTITRIRRQTVPPEAPGGQYVCWGFVGDYPWTVTDSDSFPFTKQGAGGEWNGSGGWVNTGEPFPGEEQTSEVYPSSFILHPCSPNPFNSSTTLRFDLPEPAQVMLEVFDVNGRHVGAKHSGNASPLTTRS